jgi:hypothetical protein
LELSGDLRIRGPEGIRKLRHNSKGSPYFPVIPPSHAMGNGGLRQRPVKIHRAVMSFVLGRAMARDELSVTATTTRGTGPGNL